MCDLFSCYITVNPFTLMNNVLNSEQILIIGNKKHFWVELQFSRGGAFIPVAPLLATGLTYGVTGQVWFIG